MNGGQCQGEQCVCTSGYVGLSCEQRESSVCHHWPKIFRREIKYEFRTKETL